MTGVLDTNIVLYLLGGQLAAPLPPGPYCVSVITEMELLSFPTITPPEEARIREFLNSVTVVELTADVRDRALSLRRGKGLRLPDAIVAATAECLDTDLFTNDERLGAAVAPRWKQLTVRA